MKAATSPLVVLLDSRGVSTIRSSRRRPEVLLPDTTSFVLRFRISVWATPVFGGMSVVRLLQVAICRNFGSPTGMLLCGAFRFRVGRSPLLEQLRILEIEVDSAGKTSPRPRVVCGPELYEWCIPFEDRALEETGSVCPSVS